jgi:hypothetical protein
MDDCTYAANEYRPTPPTAEHLQARREENERLKREYKVIQKARQAAIKRAKALLRASLSEDQQKQYDENKSFIVIGQKTKRKYRIREGRVANIDVFWEDRPGVRHKLCAHPGEQVPDADTMLAQKLMLECNENDFLNLANIH